MNPLDKNKRQVRLGILLASILVFALLMYLAVGRLLALQAPVANAIDTKMSDNSLNQQNLR